MPSLYFRKLKIATHRKSLTNTFYLLKCQEIISAGNFFFQIVRFIKDKLNDRMQLQVDCND